jgi:biopolymer transport protein ExbB
MDNYFQVLLTGGGMIGYTLWLLSIVTVGIIVQYFIAIRRETIVPDLLVARLRQLLDAENYREVIEVTTQDTSFLSRIVHAALREAANGFGAMERALEEAAEQYATGMLRKIEWLNLVGNISPMLGLLGTVWGMIGAFMQILHAGGGTPTPGLLAGSIGKALVTTLLGLAIAIPALAVYSVMRNRIDALTSEAMLASQSLLSAFRKPIKPQARQATQEKQLA